MTAIPRTESREAAYARLDDLAAYAQTLRARRGISQTMRGVLREIADDLDRIGLLPRVVLHKEGP